MPVWDPTWYGPISILLGAVEVDLASICASIPVFWPVVEKQLGKIFVTQEIRVTHHNRLSEVDDYEMSGSKTPQLSRAESVKSLVGSRTAISASRGTSP